LCFKFLHLFRWGYTSAKNKFFARGGPKFSSGKKVY
jgi:hypothetical protein